MNRLATTILTVVLLVILLYQNSWAEQWQINFNSYPGTMELNRSGSSYSGRFNLHDNWEQMLDIQVYDNAIFFRRASADQKYLGIIEGNRMKGIFTQHGTGRYPWSAEKAHMQTPPTVPDAPNHGGASYGGSSHNLAFKKKVRQSSTGYGGNPEKAVDGNKDGNYSANSVSHTSNSPNEWWEVDLGDQKHISELKIWNRTDCCSERLSNFYVMVSPVPFASGSLSSLLNDHTVWKYNFKGTAGREATIPVSANGRYVRIQLAGQNWLSLAEVEVLGSNIAGTGQDRSSFNPSGTWRHGAQETWIIRQNPDGSFHAQEHGYGNAGGPAYFTASGTFRIDYVTRDRSVTGYYEVRFSPDGRTASGRVQELTGPKRSGSTNWTKIQ